jgi:hypothetical protein
MAFGDYGYVLFQAERSKTTTELRAEDARRGELAAALSRASAVLTAALHRPFRWRRASRPVAPVAGTPVTGYAPASARPRWHIVSS